MFLLLRLSTRTPCKGNPWLTFFFKAFLNKCRCALVMSYKLSFLNRTTTTKDPRFFMNSSSSSSSSFPFPPVVPVVPVVPVLPVVLFVPVLPVPWCNNTVSCFPVARERQEVEGCEYMKLLSTCKVSPYALPPSSFGAVLSCDAPSDSAH